MCERVRTPKQICLLGPFLKSGMCEYFLFHQKGQFRWSQLASDHQINSHVTLSRMCGVLIDSIVVRLRSTVPTPTWYFPSSPSHNSISSSCNVKLNDSKNKLFFLTEMKKEKKTFVHQKLPFTMEMLIKIKVPDQWHQMIIELFVKQMENSIGLVDNIQEIKICVL